jgi:SAM-dependent methyltransferase
MSDDFDVLVAEAEQAHFSGWDFGYLRGRWEQTEPPWDYEAIVRQHMAGAHSLLDIGTGGGEFLAALSPLPPRTVATENYEPNIPIARARLEPLGVQVVTTAEELAAHVPDGSLDLAINRHDSLWASEVAQALRPGGRYVTQQIGGRDDERINEVLGGPPHEYADWLLDAAVAELEDAGLVVEAQAEAFPETHFFDIGALVYYLKVISWQMPGFTVEGYRDGLRRIHAMIRADGRFSVASHRFLIEARRSE